MKLRLIFAACLLITSCIRAQDITGVWRGYFNSGYGYFKQQYKYEVQINQLRNTASMKGLQGVTYSYHSTVFYGKATLQGIYDGKNKSLTIKEIELVELKIADKSEPCLMTCYLDYRKEGTVEILEGTFTSINAKTKADCGAGYVYLERVKESEFKKEDFLLKKKSVTSPPVAKTDTSKKSPPKTSLNTAPKKQQSTTQQKTAPQKTTPQKKTTPPPVAKKKTNPTVVKKDSSAITKTQPQKKITGSDTIAKSNSGSTPPVVNPPVDKDLTKKTVPIPDVIKKRENTLIKTIVTNSPNIQIQLFDNGEIDGDTITVYDNNEVIANRKGLTGKPITLSIKADLFNAHHEFVMVANNLGSIPPNTALMVITTGGKRYELFISSDEKKNAKVVIDYKMPGKES